MSRLKISSSLILIISLLFSCMGVYAEKYLPSDWFEESIMLAQSYGLVSNDISDKPYTVGITRLEFCTYALNYYKIIKPMPEKTDFEIAFKDTTDKNVLYAAELGIINGRGDGVFSPEDKITRQEMATIIVRLLSACGTDTAISGADAVNALSQYTDTDALADWAINPVVFCLGEGIIKGMSENELWPEYHTTREQAIVIICRSFERFAPDITKPTPTPTPSPTISADVDYTDLDVHISENLTLDSYNDRTLNLSFEPIDGAEKYKIDIYLDMANFWYANEDTYVKTLYSDTNSFTFENVRIGKMYKINIYGEGTDDVIVATSYIEPKFTLAEKNEIIFGGGEIKSKEQADALMEKVEVNVWRINKSGDKYASTIAVEVHKNIAGITKAAFEEIFENGEAFPIKDAGAYAWRDEMSSGRYSHHNYGTAIDINYNENYCLYKDGSFIGDCYLPGENIYSIAPEGAVVSIFSKYGFVWGGDEWSNPKDYMHFSYLEL